MLERVIQEFGHRMDIADLGLDEQGMLCIDIENIGRLHIEQDQATERVFVCLSLPYPEFEKHIPRKLLETCSYLNKHSIDLRGGVHGGWATLVSTMSTTDIQVAALENTIRTLAAELEKIIKN